MILHELVSHDFLRVVWWLLLGILLIDFALNDGFDMGVGALIPFVGKTDVERRVAINTVGPVWEGNQVWFILGGRAILAAWPPPYALSFSGFYLSMFVVLAALIVRPVAFKYRSTRDSATWRSAWDWALFASEAVPALLIVAPGLVLDHEAIPGFSLDMVGRNGIGALYAGPAYAAKTWEAAQKFTEEGGIGLFIRPATEMNCAGAPLKLPS